MSRTQSQGVDYFPMAVDFFSDKKIKILKARYGSDGITIYLYLLCQVYREGYYTRVDEDFIYMVSDDLNMEPDKVEQVMTFLFGRSMFHEQLFKSDAILTSTGIQERWQKAVSARARKSPIEVGKYWLLNESETQPFIKYTLYNYSSEKKADNSENYPFNSENYSQSKVKESNIPPISPLQGEGTDYKEVFYKAYPKLKPVRNDAQMDYQALLKAFELSAFLRGRYSMPWVRDNYDAIIRGDYADKEGTEETSRARESWYAERRAKAESAADKAKERAMQDSEYAQADKQVRMLAPKVAFERDASKRAQMEKELEQAEAARQARLKELGIDLQIHYHCEQCKDTGYLPSGKPCGCYKEI